MGLANKMMNKKIFILGGVLLLCILFIGVALVSAQVSYCCEKIANGAWCQNAPREECDSGFRAVPTSCEATSYCKLGTCINSQEGICMENTPEVRCSETGGLWKEGEPDEIPQCQLGCCLIGEQAAFVTQTKCKKLSSLYGLETNYRTDIQSEIECIASAMPKVKGACVFEKEYEITCLLLTKKECQEMDAEFHEGYLCSAEELATNCGPRGGTTCVEGKDGVYFLDTCGNLANIYDSSKINNKAYWTYIAGTKAGVEVDCGSGSNADSTTCGDCDYFSGSTCKAYERGETARPNYGDYICKDLGCEDEDFQTKHGKQPQHGETWCAEAKGVGAITVDDQGMLSGSEENLPGGRYFRLICYNGEVSVEPCADFRQEVCIESEVGGFRVAACRVNMWQDCYAQENIKDCENFEKRDCKVVEGFSILKDENGKSLFEDEDGNKVDASCVPKFAPGFNFWEAEGDAESLCSLGNMQCFVEYEKKIGSEKKVSGDWKCMEECRADCTWDDPLGICKNKCKDDCPATCVDSEGNVKSSWIREMNELCSSLGDCGVSVNYLGKQGYYDDPEDLVRRGEEDEED